MYSQSCMERFLVNALNTHKTTLKLKHIRNFKPIEEELKHTTEMGILSHEYAPEVIGK